MYRLVCVGPVKKTHCWFSHEAAQFCSLDDGVYIVNSIFIRKFACNLKRSRTEVQKRSGLFSLNKASEKRFAGQPITGSFNSKGIVRSTPRRG